MLITTCGHCGARFRVTPQQLNAKQGQVKCGSCERVFNGFESLERHPDDDTGSRLPHFTCPCFAFNCCGVTRKRAPQWPQVVISIAHPRAAPTALRASLR